MQDSDNGKVPGANHQRLLSASMHPRMANTYLSKRVQN